MKRALVLSGGGSKGAYQAGVIQALTLVNKYSIVTGVSVGAMNGAFIAQADDQYIAARELCHMWQSIETRDIYKKWFLWPLSILWKPSIYDSSPLERLIRENIDADRLIDSKTVFRAGMVSYNTGGYYSMDHIPAITASATFPVCFTPVKIAGQYYIDGGIRNVTPLSDAINEGANVVDVVMCSAKGLTLVDDEPNVLSTAKRSMDIMMDEIIDTDVKLAQAYNKLVDADPNCGKRKIEINIYRPHDSLNTDPLKFNRDQINTNLHRGFMDAVGRIYK